MNRTILASSLTIFALNIFALSIVILGVNLNHDNRQSKVALVMTTRRCEVI
jgi:hypothetical protein